MDGKTTVKYLQNYIKQKDFHPELLKDYFLKLSEEVGELSRAIQKNFKTDSSLSSSGLSQIKYPASVAFEDGR